jgi:UDP-GlcNAc3NAcA epimerase
MLEGIENQLLDQRPHWVLVYGDTNSTLAGALAAAKLNIPIAHVEAGLRSFNSVMPEEINRVLTDHVSTLLLCPTQLAVKNLNREGIRNGVHKIGDVMYDAALHFGEIAKSQSTILDRFNLTPQNFALATVHRAENVDDPGKLRSILRGLSRVSERYRVILPIHPRTRHKIKESGLADEVKPVEIIDPVSFLDMVRLEQASGLILTDSGGVQKEAYFHGVPCVTLREQTEWEETIDQGWNKLVGANENEIVSAAATASCGRPIPEYGNGSAAFEILGCIGEAHRELALDPR